MLICIVDPRAAPHEKARADRDLTLRTQQAPVDEALLPDANYGVRVSDDLNAIDIRSQPRAYNLDTK